MKVKEWCIALDNVSSYIDPVLDLRYKFLKGERATKEKVFSMIPSMTEEEYARYFRPATDEEINGKFEWDGKQYVLEKPKRMKSIKEKAIETERNTHPLFESFRESTGEPVSVYDQDDMISMFEQGANYVLEELEKTIKRAGYYSDMLLKSLFYEDLKYMIQELKK